MTTTIAKPPIIPYACGDTIRIAHYAPDHPLWPAVWDHLLRALHADSNPRQCHLLDPTDGWQYIGTWYCASFVTHRPDGRPLRPRGYYLAWTHQFRHPDWRGNGPRYILVEPDDLTHPEDSP